jgi:NAD(P)-dependent dehydrogenase (short-subunit alcohol dehydrogenase family)
MNPGSGAMNIYERCAVVVADISGAESWSRPRLEAHAIGRLAEPEDIGAAALFLASDDASFVTNAAPCVDGGFTVA